MNARGEDGDSPLHIACLYGQTAVVLECLKRGADVNAKDEDDSTPLHDACAGGFELIVAALLQRGAAFDAKDSDEETPLHHACRGGHAAVVERILKACPDSAARVALIAAPNAAGETAAHMAEGPVKEILAQAAA